MNALIVADAHLYRTPDGSVWTETIYGYEFWQRYLEVFDTISVAARMTNVEFSSVEGFLRSDGTNVSFKPMPMARSSKEYLANFFNFISASRDAVRDEKCAIVRLPSFQALFLYRSIRKKGIPFAVEVVADPSIVNNGIISQILKRQINKAVLEANGVAYVTKYALQKNYPSYARINGESKYHFEEYYSSIKLDDSSIGCPRKYERHSKRLKLVHTSNAISHDEKGHSIVIKVVRNLIQLGYDTCVTFIGGGSLIGHFQDMAKQFGIENNVHFIGRLKSSDEVRAELERNDVFIFPSKSEGLPRAIIEAMAVGLPCLSTPVGGIPELIDEEYLFDPLDEEGFTKTIKRFIDHPEEMEEQSQKNIERAKEYRASVLQAKRNAFFSKVKALVEE